MLQPIVHYTLHLLAPALLAWLFFRDRWKQAWMVMLATMLVDLDHLFAFPVFDPNRCSIGFHYLHTFPATIAYFLLLFWRPMRIVAMGLLFHMFTDWQDCWWMR